MPIVEGIGVADKLFINLLIESILVAIISG